MPDQYVNDQIVESVADVVTLNIGQAPSQSSAMLDVVMAETIGMSMYNAVSRQQSSSTVGSAAVTAACAKMLQTPFPIRRPAPPIPPPHHGVEPLPYDVSIASVDARATEAIDELTGIARASDAAAATATLEALSDHIADAIKSLQGGNTPPPSPPSPPSPPPPSPPSPPPSPSPA
jgi:hypothetical protein